MELHSPNFCFFVSTKFNARNIFNQRPIVISKIVKIIFVIVHSHFHSHAHSHFHSYSHFHSHCSDNKKVVGKMKDEYGGKPIYMFNGIAFNKIAFTKSLFLCEYQI